MPALALHSPSARAETAQTLPHVGEALGGGTLTCSSLQPGELVFRPPQWCVSGLGAHMNLLGTLLK